MSLFCLTSDHHIITLLEIPHDNNLATVIIVNYEPFSHLNRCSICENVSLSHLKLHITKELPNTVRGFSHLHQVKCVSQKVKKMT